MIEKIEERLALKLVPYRKRMVVIMLMCLVVGMPASCGFAFLSKSWNVFFICQFLSVLGLLWSSGLHMLQYCFNPSKGPYTLKKIQSAHGLIKWYSYLMRYGMFACLPMWFLMPLVVLHTWHVFVSWTTQ